MTITMRSIKLISFYKDFKALKNKPKKNKPQEKVDNDFRNW